MRILSLIALLSTHCFSQTLTIVKGPFDYQV